MQPTTAAANQRRVILTYEELCSFEVLYKAYLEARKGKRSKSKTIEYEAQALAGRRYPAADMLCAEQV